MTFHSLLALTDAAQLALIAAIAPTLAALAALIMGIVNSRKSDRNSDKADAVNDKANTLIEKTAEIHTLTNSNLTEVRSELREANQKILGMENLVRSIQEGMSRERTAREKPVGDGTPPGPQEVEIVNTPDSPVPTVESGKKK